MDNPDFVYNRLTFYSERNESNLSNLVHDYAVKRPTDKQPTICLDLLAVHGNDYY